MGKIYITRDHLNMVGMATKEEVKGNLALAVTSLAVSTGLGALVGYRHAAGVTEEEAMPTLGPVPVDAIAGGIGTVAGIFMKGTLGKVILGAGLGAGNVFTMSAGQSLGAMLHDKMAASGSGQEMPSKQIAPGTPRYRDMHGNYHPGRPRTMGTGSELPTSAQVAAATPSAPAPVAATKERWKF